MAMMMFVARAAVAILLSGSMGAALGPYVAANHGVETARRSVHAEPDPPRRTAAISPPARKPGAGSAAPEAVPTQVVSPQSAASDSEEDDEEAVQATVPLPSRKPAKPGPVHPSQADAPDWSDEEINAALAACAELLRGLPVEFETEAPVREGICGTPAPIKVSSIGDDPPVEIKPAATMTCPLAAALASWVRSSVQPAAVEHLGVSIARFHNVASYTCRNRYNAPGQRISEHAFANALDLAVFETAAGEKISVLDFWNATNVPPPPLPQRAPDKPAVTEVEKTANREGTPQREAVPSVTDMAKPNRLRQAAQKKSSGPPLIDTPLIDLTEGKIALAPPPTPDRRSLFLRQIHREACNSFGTVLGPEANAAHANHFHLDKAARRHSAFCE